MSLSSDDERESIVFDIGSHSARVGFAGEDAPSVNVQYVTSAEFKETYCYNGYKLFSSFDDSKLDLLENVISNCISLLDNSNKGLIKESPAIFSEHFHDIPSKRENLIELMFEKFEVPAFYTAPCPVLALYSSGRGSGIVLESGNSVTETIVIYEGYMIANSVFSQNRGGAEVTQYLKDHFGSDKSKGEEIAEADFVYLKETYSSCSYNEPVTEVKLPDGTVHNLRSTHLKGCTDSLFQCPGFKSLPDMVYESVMTASIHSRRDLFCNVILSGGNTMISGFPALLKNQLEVVMNKRHKGLKLNVIAAPERKYSTWIGGSILGSLSCFMNSLLITREEYMESGCSILAKCISPKNVIKC
ncbi:hypothetical protein ACHWQZ_G005416 [Mnemiopsis leidyi]